MELHNNRDNIAVIVLLESVDTGAGLVVANTHLLFSPKKHEIRLGQTVVLLAEINKIAQLRGKQCDRVV